ncbi:MAG: tripartite tricarboxylate transporter substrate binding protein [Burkholderiales bacterium]
MRNRLSALSFYAGTCAGLCAVAAPLPVAGANVSQAVSYPTRPIRLIVPAGASSNGDYRARQLAQKVSAALGQQMVVDNRPGANTIIGTEVASRAAADGHTLLFSFHSFAINPFLYSKLPYDSSKKFAPVAGFNIVPVGLFLNAAVPANSVRELIALAKAKPDDLTCVSVGIGSGQHLSCHQFNRLTGSKIRIIHYKEMGQGVTDMLGGQISMVFDGLPVPLPLVKSGKLKALAISGANRVSSLPSLPTFREAGLAEFDMAFWTGVFAPTGTPQIAIDTINRETNAALKAPDIVQSLTDTGGTPLGGSSADFTAFVKAQSERWGAVIKDSGVRLD